MTPTLVDELELGRAEIPAEDEQLLEDEDRDGEGASIPPRKPWPPSRRRRPDRPPRWLRYVFFAVMLMIAWAVGRLIGVAWGSIDRAAWGSPPTRVRSEDF